MVKKIMGTVGTRILTAVMALVVWTLNARYLGPEQVGTISLIIFSVAVIQLFTNFMAGAALIYLTPRTEPYKLFVPAYVWTFIVTILAGFLLHMAGLAFPVIGLVPEGYLYHVMLLALIMSLASANNMILLGLERVKASNLVNLMQMVLLFAILLLILFGYKRREVMAYYIAILVSYAISMLAGILLLRKDLRMVPLQGMKPLCREILRFGTYVQFANIFQTMNYRLSLKFTDHFLGRGAVGVLSLGMQLAEGLWLISRSIATVQYSRLSNAMDEDYSKRLTLALAKVSFTVTASAMMLLLAIPSAFFQRLFTTGFADVKLVIASLAPGIVALSVSMILSGYFSAINKPYHNTISSAIGLFFTISLGVLLIPVWGLAGAGFAATLSYTAVTLYQFVVFVRLSHFTPGDFLLKRADIDRLLTGLKEAGKM